MSTVWRPLDCFQEKSDLKIALVLLNQPDPYNKPFLTSLWKKAQFCASVDGGTNHLYNVFKDNPDAFLPDIITGDFDSIKDSVKKFYQDKGVEFVSTPDQDYTDFTKAVKEVGIRIHDKKIDCICVYGTFGGRFDHVFGNINTLFEADQFTSTVVLQFSDDTVAFLLQKCNHRGFVKSMYGNNDKLLVVGEHKILVDPALCGEWCGLIPVGGACQCVTTQGLKWNLDKGVMRFGELISTSNTLQSKETNTVTVETDSPLLWIMGIST